MTIKELQELVHTLTLERDSAREKIDRIMSGLEGCCMTCEPIGVRNQQMEHEIATLKAERDEARRRLCIWAQDDSHGDGREYAKEQGWDCFKENTND